jgi:hypothetical protein
MTRSREETLAHYTPSSQRCVKEQAKETAEMSRVAYVFVS